MNKRSRWLCLFFVAGCLFNGLADEDISSTVKTNSLPESTTNAQEARYLIPVLKNYYTSLEFDKAEKLSQQIIDLTPNDPQTWEYLGIIYVTEGKYDKAIPILKKSFSMGSINSLHFLFKAYQRKNDPQGVHDLIPQMLENKTNDPAMTDDLVTYARQQNPPDKSLFYQAIEGLSNGQIIDKYEWKIQQYVGAFQEFGDTNRAKQLMLDLADRIKAKEDKVIDAAQQFTPEKRQQFIHGYEQNPLRYRSVDLFAVAIAYFYETQYEKSREVYEKLDFISPSDIHVLKGLGNCYLFETNFEGAISQYRKAWNLGDSNSIWTLSVAYLGSTNVERMRDLIPFLMENKQKNLATVLAFTSSVKPFDKEVFTKAVEGVTDDELLKNAQIAKIAISGFEQIGQTNRADTLKAKLQK